MYVVSYMVELENLHCHVIITSISWRYSGLLVPLTDELHSENILEVVGHSALPQDCSEVLGTSKNFLTLQS